MVYVEGGITLLKKRTISLCSGGVVAVSKGKWVPHLQVGADLVSSQIDVSVVGTHHLLGNTLDHVAPLILEQRVRLHPML